MAVDEIALGRLEGQVAALIAQQAEFRRETNEHLSAIRGQLATHATELAERRGEKAAHRRTTGIIAACVSGVVSLILFIGRWVLTGRP